LCLTVYTFYVILRTQWNGQYKYKNIHIRAVYGQNTKFFNVSAGVT
jgi:hypothetical protein